MLDNFKSLLVLSSVIWTISPGAMPNTFWVFGHAFKIILRNIYFYSVRLELDSSFSHKKRDPAHSLYHVMPKSPELILQTLTSYILGICIVKMLRDTMVGMLLLNVKTRVNTFTCCSNFTSTCKIRLKIFPQLVDDPNDNTCGSQLFPF